ncbi:MAG: glycosyltransferase family 39 protein [Gammaproteobacteria bacterium]|nr:glycosyltransferase family 39 protein [Gammaproteobacteria bacterium]
MSAIALLWTVISLHRPRVLCSRREAWRMDVERRPSDAGDVAGRDWGFRALLFAACLALYLLGSSQQSVFDRDEARFSLAAKEMSERGDWLLPSNFGEPRYNKPILSYWLALASTRVLGMNESALRLPSALCGALAVLFTMVVAQRMGGRRVARIAGVVLATALYVVIEARSFTADASLLAATTLSFLAWQRLRAGPEHRHRWQLLLWTSIGLGLLAKVVNVAFVGAVACALVMLESPPATRIRNLVLAAVVAGAVATAVPGLGAVGPGILAIVATAFVAASLRRPDGRAAWRRFGAHWGVPLALAMLLAWGIPAALATHGGFASEGLGHHLLGRTVTPYEGHSGWPGYYLVATVIAFFPWGALLPAALANAWRHRGESDTAYLLAWVLGPLVVAELTVSKLPHYMLVTFPALAILAATLVESRILRVRAWTRFERTLEATLFGIVCVCVAAIGGYLGERFVGAPAHAAALVLATVSLGVGIVVAFSWLHGRPETQVPIAAVGAAALWLSAFVGLLPALEQERLSPRLGAVVAGIIEPGEQLVLCKVGESSIGFYLPRTPDLMGDPDAVARKLRTSTGDALVVVPDDDRHLLARIQSGDAARWETVGVVEGLILPSLSVRRIQLARRHGADDVPTT